jgi:hypothetical protein
VSLHARGRLVTKPSNRGLGHHISTGKPRTFQRYVMVITERLPPHKGGGEGVGMCTVRLGITWTILHFMRSVSKHIHYLSPLNSYSPVFKVLDYIEASCSVNSLSESGNRLVSGFMLADSWSEDGWNEARRSRHSLTDYGCAREWLRQPSVSVLLVSRQNNFTSTTPFTYGIFLRRGRHRKAALPYSSVMGPGTWIRLTVKLLMLHFVNEQGPCRIL